MPYLQSNGDIMAFNAWVDEHFLHRVYPQKVSMGSRAQVRGVIILFSKEASGPRISIILMGRTSIFEDQASQWQSEFFHSCRSIGRIVDNVTGSL